MTDYIGRRLPDRTLVVTINDDHRQGTPLPWRLDLLNHSPTGLECGYAGSGPAQLALAILAHHTGDDERATRLHQEFKREVIQGLPRDAGWTLTGAAVDGALRRIDPSGAAHG